MNRSALLSLRLNLEISVNHLHSLTHADESQSLAGQSLVFVKSGSAIAYGQVNLVRGATQFDGEMAHAAMFDRIVQCLLQDSEQTKRDFFR